MLSRGVFRLMGLMRASYPCSSSLVRLGTNCPLGDRNSQWPCSRYFIYRCSHQNLSTAYCQRDRHVYGRDWGHYWKRRSGWSGSRTHVIDKRINWRQLQTAHANNRAGTGLRNKSLEGVRVRWNGRRSRISISGMARKLWYGSSRWSFEPGHQPRRGKRRTDMDNTVEG